MSAPKPWTILSSKILHQTPWISVIEDECQVAELSSTDKPFTYTYVQRRDEGPMIIAENPDGKLWLVQQYRHPIKKVVWQFPAEGKMANESWADAAQRGLAEEIGQKAATLVDLGLLYVDPGLLSQKTHIFFASGLTPVSVEKYKTAIDEVEELNAHAFSLTEIEELIQKGEMADNWGMAGLYMYQRYKQQRST